VAGFAVIDFETTGLFPGAADRVIEVAVVQLSSRGQFEGRWESLVNPGRYLGRAHSHRIHAQDVRDAPTFAELAPRLLELVQGRVVVAHNASFDVRFLRAELELAGLTPPADIVTLCTMQLARDFLPGSGRSLTDCCAALDIDLDDGHRAAGDARATARLLAAYIEAADAPEFWTAHLTAAAETRWPVAAAPAARWRERTVSSHPMTTASFLEHLVSRLPNTAGPAEYADYLALLDRCLIDRTLSTHEADSLARLAGQLGLEATVAANLNRQFYTALTALAWTDGILTTAELGDLVNVGMLLGQPTEAIAAALDETRQQTPAPAGGVELGAGFRLRPGDQVVLTGDMNRVRSDWERELRGLGLVPWSAVTKKVRLLVAADTDSLSGKARKARDYGIPIVDEATLVRLASACGTRAESR